MSSKSVPKPVFQPGRVVISPGVIDLSLKGRLDAIDYFKRHVHGDWGQVPPAYGVMNELALERKERLFSGFKVSSQLTLWVVTLLDRGVTTLLLPDEHESFQDELKI